MVLLSNLQERDMKNDVNGKEHLELRLWLLLNDFGETALHQQNIVNCLISNVMYDCRTVTFWNNSVFFHIAKIRQNNFHGNKVKNYRNSVRGCGRDGENI